MTNAAKFDVDPETLSQIRGMLADEQTRAPAPAPEASARAERRPTPRPGPEPTAATSRPGRRSLGLPQLGGWRPSRRLVLGAALLAPVLIRPAWVVLALVLTLFTVIGAFLFLGSERVWDLLVGLLKCRMARDPERAPQIAARMDRFADCWDRMLDIFPNGTVDALYFPDLQGLMEADERHAAVVADRLARLHSQV